MDLKQIRYFVAVYEEGSFSKAALREHSSQPGISLHIQHLETELGLKFFERTGRGVVPSAAGAKFYKCCLDILAATKSARQSMMDLAGSVAGAINIGLPPSFCKAALPSMLGAYAAAYPHVDLRIAEAYSGTLTDWVVAGELEAAIVTDPPSHLNLEITPFRREPLFLVRRAGSASKTGRKGRKAKRTASSLNLVLPSARHSLRRSIEELRYRVPEIGRIIEIDGLTATVELVCRSDWVTFLPVSSIFEEVKQGRLEAEEISDLKPTLDFFLIQTNSLPLSPAARLFLQSLKQTLEGIPAEWMRRKRRRAAS